MYSKLVNPNMRYFCILFLILICTASSVQSQTNPKHIYVKGHWRNGTYVQPYYRTAPNSTNRDNFSTQGNVNPYTGKPGWISPDNRYSSTSNRQSSARSNQNQYNTDLITSHNERIKVGKYPNGYVYATTKSKGQLWQRPSQMDVIRPVPKNSFVRILDYEDEFWKVVYNGTVGYMHTVSMDVNNDMFPLKAQARRSYQPVTHSKSIATPAHSIKKQVKTVEYASWSSVRPGRCALDNRKSITDYYFVVQAACLNNEPTKRGKPVGKISFGDKVNVICSEGKWYEVVYQNRTGWVEKRLLRK